MGESSFAKTWLDAQHTVVDLRLLIRERSYKISKQSKESFLLCSRERQPRWINISVTLACWYGCQVST